MADDRKPAAKTPESDSDRIERLEAELEGLRDLIKSGAVNAVAVREKETREEWYQQQAKEISKGNVVRTQEAADRQFPEGRKRYRCVLTDCNRHPEILVRADNETDAVGRYLAVCGINSAEKKVTLAEVKPEASKPLAGASK